MSDLISRQELYHEMTVKSMELFEKGLAWHEFRRGFNFAMEFVQEAPSAESEIITIEELSYQLGCATIQSALYWFEFLKTLDLLGFAIIRKETR